MKNRINVCAVDTVYGLLIYFLRFGYNPNDVFILSSGVPEKVRNNLNHFYFPGVFDYNNDSSFFNRVIKKNILWISGVLKLYLFIFIKSFNKEMFIYGHPHTAYGFIFCIFKNCYVIEDGSLNYRDLKEPKLSFFDKILLYLGSYRDDILAKCGTHPNIKKVYLVNKPPEIIKDKTEIFDMDQAWDNKTSQEKNKILEIFSLGDIEIKDNYVLFVTQCFSEDGLLPYDEEMAISKSIIENNENVIIKPHPRENKDYNSLFPNVHVIPAHFPIELLKLIGIKFKKVISVNSTVCLNFKNSCEVEFYKGPISNENLVHARDILELHINEE